MVQNKSASPAKSDKKIEATTSIFKTPFTMGKRSRKELDLEEQKSNGIGDVKKSILADDKAIDPSLALLFSSSVSQLSACW